MPPFCRGVVHPTPLGLRLAVSSLCAGVGGLPTTGWPSVLLGPKFTDTCAAISMGLRPAGKTASPTGPVDGVQVLVARLGWGGEGQGKRKDSRPADTTDLERSMALYYPYPLGGGLGLVFYRSTLSPR